MKDFVEYLERMIEGCDSLGGMEREKATYQSILKEYRKQFNIANVVGRSEQLFCSCGSRKVKTTGGSQCTNNRCSL